MNLTRHIYWIPFAIILCSCARQTAPTGGPKDTIPPIVINTIPPDEQINFKGNEIKLLFSEDVILNSPKEQIIVTPAINKDYEIKYRKNIVTLTFAEPLEDSTTYTFNFREAIQDITEKNPAENLKLAISTGSYIDSLSISGTVYNILEGKPAKDATVALHVENDTFNIFQHPTTIFTKTDDEGNYKIDHLKPGKYFLYAMIDKNRNLTVNSRNEAYGFLAEYQDLHDTLANKSIGLVRLDAGPLKLTSARPYNTYFNIRTNKNLRTFTLEAADSSNLTYTFGENNANIRIYKTTTQDSLAVHLTAFDSIDNEIDTILYAKYLTRQVTPEKFDLSIPKSSLLADKGLLDFEIAFTKPVAKINFDSLFFQVDSLTKITFTPEDLSWDPLLRKFTVHKKIDPAIYHQEETSFGQPAAPPPARPRPGAKPFPTNQLILGTGAFISVEQDTSRHLSQAIKPMREQDLSVINLEIRTSAPAFIVQLVNNNYKVIQEVRNQHKVRFTDVEPGDYQARLIIDRNDNGRWDPGNYFKKQEPEPVIYYRTPDGATKINGVKANWEVGTDGEMFITY